MALIDEIETLLDRKLDEKLDEHLDAKLDTRFEDFEKKFGNKLGAFMEHLDDKFDSLAEAAQTTLEIVSNQPSREEFDALKSEVRTIRSAVTATNQDLRKLTHA
jgi:hypothetical protein